MGLFFPDNENRFTHGRATGFARYRQVLEGCFKEFFLVGFITLLFLLPFALGMAYAILTSSALVMLAASILGGAVSGPGIACMYDIILRRLRDDRSDWWVCYRKSMRQNWRAAVLPGIVQCVFLGFLIFSCALLWWAQRPVSIWTAAILLLASVLFLTVLSVWWPQVVLFDQKPGLQLKNTVLFVFSHAGRVLGAAALQAGWWVAGFLFLPWTAFLVPFLNVWYILFLAVFLLYRPMDDAFRIEDQINERFPGQIQPMDETAED